MDPETVQLLQELPADLRERGWALSLSGSRLVTWKTPRYTAVYVRPFDGHLDLQALHSATFDHRTRQRIVRVSTRSDASPSWRDVHRDVIRRMRWSIPSAAGDGEAFPVDSESWSRPMSDPNG